MQETCTRWTRLPLFGPLRVEGVGWRKTMYRLVNETHNYQTLTPHWQFQPLVVFLFHENNENNRITFLFWNEIDCTKNRYGSTNSWIKNSILFCFTFQRNCIVTDFLWQDTFIAQRDAHEDLVQNEYWVDARTRVMNNVMEVLCLMLKSFSEHDCAQKSTSTFPDIGSFCWVADVGCVKFIWLQTPSHSIIQPDLSCVVCSYCGYFILFYTRCLGRTLQDELIFFLINVLRQFEFSKSFSFAFFCEFGRCVGQRAHQSLKLGLRLEGQTCHTPTSMLVTACLLGKALIRISGITAAAGTVRRISVDKKTTYGWRYSELTLFRSVCPR